MLSTQEMLEVIPIPQKDEGGKFCNAIDEDLFDSSEWSNNMPSDGYTFFQGEDSVSVTYASYFACYDGWDMMDEDHGEYPDMYTAVKHVYDMIIHDAKTAKLRTKLKSFKDIALDNLIKISDLPFYYGACNLINLELRYTK